MLWIFRFCFISSVREIKYRSFVEYNRIKFIVNASCNISLKQWGTSRYVRNWLFFSHNSVNQCSCLLSKSNLYDLLSWFFPKLILGYYLKLPITPTNYWLHKESWMRRLLLQSITVSRVLLLQSADRFGLSHGPGDTTLLPGISCLSFLCFPSQ